MKAAKRMKQATTTAPKPGLGKKQTAGHGMGGMFGNVTPKKPEPDEKAPKRSQTRPKGLRARLDGVKL